ELLQLRQDAAAELQILLTDQAEPAAKLFVRCAQGHELALLGVDAVAQRVAVDDEVLDRRSAGESDALDGGVGAARGEVGLRSRRYDLSQGFNHCNQLRVVGGTGRFGAGALGSTFAQNCEVARSLSSISAVMMNRDINRVEAREGSPAGQSGVAE